MDDMRIEAPPGLLPNLYEWGIEEVETGVCEDSFENRRTLRENKASWVSIFDQTGQPTGNLQVITAEMRDAAMLYRKNAILVDPNNSESDYETGMNLMLTPDVDKIAPTWVLARTRQWMRDEDEREEMGSVANIHPSRLVRAPSRCTARKPDGARCWFWNDGSMNSDSLCSMHSKKHKTKTNVKPDLITLARNRIISAAGAAADELESLMMTATSEPVRLGAAKELLDRAGIRGGMDINTKVEHTIADPANILKQRLDELQAKSKRREELLELVARPAEDTTETVEVVILEEDNDR